MNGGVRTQALQASTAEHRQADEGAPVDHLAEHGEPAGLTELSRTFGAGEILMSGTRPDVRLLLADMIGRAYRRVLRDAGPSLLSYDDPAGLLCLRHGLAAVLSATRGIAVDPDTILVTRGSQMALAVIARALIRPGDAVAVEDPGYRPAWEAFKIAGAKIVPVPVDEYGLDVERLQRLTASRSIRALSHAARPVPHDRNAHRGAPPGAAAAGCPQTFCHHRGRLRP